MHSVAEAEAVYREDLKQHPGNGWALFGLARAFAEQQRMREATAAREQFASAWRNADVQLTALAF